MNAPNKELLAAAMTAIQVAGAIAYLEGCEENKAMQRACIMVSDRLGLTDDAALALHVKALIAMYDDNEELRAELFRGARGMALSVLTA